jgi:hypothetical protein
MRIPGKPCLPFPQHRYNGYDLADQLLPTSPLQAILPSCQPHDVASLLWALASRYQAAGLEDGGALWRQILLRSLQSAASHASSYKTSELADVVWAAAVILGGGRDVSSTEEGVGTQTSTLPLNGTSGAASSHSSGSSHLDSLLAHVRSHLAAAPPHSVTLSELAAIAWALVRLKRLDSQLTTCITQHARHLLSPVTQPKAQEGSASMKEMPSATEKQLGENLDCIAAPMKEGGMEEAAVPVGTVTQHASAPAPATVSASLSEEDAESLATLLYSLVCLSCYDPPLFMSAAPRLAPVLDLLDAEQLAQLAWAYAVTLQDAPAQAPARSTAPFTSADLQGAGGSHSSNAIIVGSTSAVLGMPAGENLQPSGAVDAHIQLLSAATAMLEAGAPRVPFGLTKPELHWLWQAHQCSQAWAAATAAASPAGATSPTVGVQPAPFQAPAALLSEALRLGTLDRASKPARRRMLAEVVNYLHQVGYQPLSLSDAEGISSALRGDGGGSISIGTAILQEAGPSWVGAVKVGPRVDTSHAAVCYRFQVAYSI